MFIILISLFALLCIVEAKNETYVINLKDPKLSNYDDLNNKEHFWSGVYYSVIVFIIAFATGFWMLVPALLLVRRLFFQETLNLMRKKGLFYLADRGMDGWMKSRFGSKAGLINDLGCLILLGLTIFIHIRLF
jgi:hypothetical protein